MSSGELHPNLVELVGGAKGWCVPPRGFFDGDGQEAEDLGLEVAHNQAQAKPRVLEIASTCFKITLKCFKMLEMF